MDIKIMVIFAVIQMYIEACIDSEVVMKEEEEAASEECEAATKAEEEVKTWEIVVPSTEEWVQEEAEVAEAAWAMIDHNSEEAEISNTQCHQEKITNKTEI